MDLASALERLGAHLKQDVTYRPTAADPRTQRVHVNAGGHDWELLLAGTKFYDTHARRGGGGGVDLVMHLWCVPFKQAANMLREAGL